ncbi:c-type cytochrome domain-containing protein, partial [Singulisphaera rosea]
MGIRFAWPFGALLISSLGWAPAFADEPVGFNKDVRPILSDACYHCHGPDKAQRKGGLRLDLEAEARKAISAGNLDESEVLRRITSEDPDERMPPPDSGRSLTSGQVETIRRWIRQGSPWEAHWSLVPPRPRTPPDSPGGWARNAIDAFILAKLQKEGLTPSPEADEVTLLRRATLDLTGL